NIIMSYYKFYFDMDVRRLIKDYGEPYSKMLGIDLKKGDTEYVKWFLASILYAKPIREESATKTFKAFESAGLTSAKAISVPGGTIWSGWLTRADIPAMTLALQTGCLMCSVTFKKNMAEAYSGST